MQHQDWTPVTLRRQKPSAAVRGFEPRTFERNVEQRLNEETEELRHNRLGKSKGERIRTARVAAGFKTQRDLALALNTRVDLVASYESGKAIPDVAMMQKLRRLLRTSL
jgi:ribosome-binding protein aMBF1 (putative translation factor)